VLASKSDQYETTVVNVAGQLQKAAAGAARELRTLSKQSRGSAASLPSGCSTGCLLPCCGQRATQLAAQISQVKQSAAGHGNSIQTFQQLLNGAH